MKILRTRFRLTRALNNRPIAVKVVPPSKLLSNRAKRILNSLKPTIAKVDFPLDVLENGYYKLVHTINSRAEEIYSPFNEDHGDNRPVLKSRGQVGDIDLANDLLEYLELLDDDEHTWFTGDLLTFACMLKASRRNPKETNVNKEVEKIDPRLIRSNNDRPYIISGIEQVEST